ncbi:MAG: hypothetical protein ACTSRZ_06075 [Promethearchaeota archaeon]
MSTARLNEIIKQLIANGFKAGIFALKDGLPLASDSVESINDKMLAAFAALASDTAERAKSDLKLANMELIKIIYEDACVICRNIEAGSTSYLLAVLADRAESLEVEKYYNDLLDWAVENAMPVLQKLASL